MKKVLHLTLYLDIGGLERMIWMLCRGQKAAGWSPQVFVYEKETGDLLPYFEKENIPVTFWRKGRGFSPALLFRILSHLRKEKIKLIHSHDLGALIYASFVKLLSFGEIKVVHTQHSFQHLNSRKMVLYEKIFPWLAERVVCVSEDLRRTYLSLGQPLEHLRVVPNGVDFDANRHSDSKRRAARGALAVSKLVPESFLDKKWVVSLGRLASVKGPQHAIKLWREAKPDENSVLIFVGPETEKGMLEKLKAQSPANVFFAGPTLEPLLWLAASDLFLSASEFEGLPMAGLEAVSCGLPMLLSQIPGHALFRGWAEFFPLQNWSEGATHLSTFLKDGKFGEGTVEETARGKLERSCGAKRMTERYIHVYEELGPL